MEELRQIGNWLLVSAWGNQRQWKEFFTSFSVPNKAGGWRSLETRLLSNLRQYKANYITIALVFSLYSFLTNWWLFFATTIVLGLYFFLFHIHKTPLVISGRLVTARQKLAAWAVFSLLLFLLFGCLMSALTLVFVIGLVIVAHGTFRTPTRFGGSSSSRVHGYFGGTGGSDDEDVDEEAGGNTLDEEGVTSMDGMGGMRRGPLPGTVETRHRKNEEYLARRQRLQSKYPNLNYQ